MSEIPEAALDEGVNALLALSRAHEAIGTKAYVVDVVAEVLDHAAPAIREQVLADAKARVEGLRQTTSRIPIDQAITYNRAIDHALAALTQPQTEKLGSCVEHGTWDIYECEDGRCPQCGDKLVPGPFPYAKAFRERVCPVPEFPAWNPQPGDAIKKEES